ncbi:MAG: hypothetical protein PHP11_00725 [Erysipelotrichaceae bacterium]|jgi:predicted PurR-regulated permease PerM|nr:hypothetical protein [Erysipelotrichaceae bacterium]
MDEFLIILSDYCLLFLPILGCIILVFIVLMVRKAVKFIDELNLTLNKVNKSIDTLDKSLEQLQVPLNTVVTISHTIDTIHAYGSKAISELIDFIVENIILIKEWLDRVLNKKKDQNEVDTIKQEDDDYVE